MDLETETEAPKREEPWREHGAKMMEFSRSCGRSATRGPALRGRIQGRVQGPGEGPGEGPRFRVQGPGRGPRAGTGAGPEAVAGYQLHFDHGATLELSVGPLLDHKRTSKLS